MISLFSISSALGTEEGTKTMKNQYQSRYRISFCACFLTTFCFSSWICDEFRRHSPIHHHYHCFPPPSSSFPFSSSSFFSRPHYHYHYLNHCRPSFFSSLSSLFCRHPHRPLYHLIQNHLAASSSFFSSLRISSSIYVSHMHHYYPHHPHPYSELLIPRELRPSQAPVTEEGRVEHTHERGI